MGGMTRDRFNQFLQSTSDLLDENAFHFFIFDGALFDRGANLYPLMRKPIYPPNSPFLNSVRRAISCLKANIKADMTRPDIQEQLNDRQGDRNALLLFGKYGKQILIAMTERNMPSITVAKCAAWFRLMQTYLPKCLARERIDG